MTIVYDCRHPANENGEMKAQGLSEKFGLFFADNRSILTPLKKIMLSFHRLTQADRRVLLLSVFA